MISSRGFISIKGRKLPFEHQDLKTPPNLLFKPLLLGSFF